jgi:hypothetical protein
MSRSTPSRTSAGAPQPRETVVPRSSRRLLVRGAALAVVLIVLAVVGALVLGDRESDVPAGPESATRTTVTPPSTPSVTPEPTEPTPTTDELPAELPAVALDGRAEAGNGVVALLPSIEAIQGTGTGPGNIAGPALRVTVRLENGTAESMSLDSVAVNVYYGAERTPASPLDDPSSAPFHGPLAPAKSADGVYVVRVPADARGDVTVEVGYRAGAPLLIFNGSAG